MTYQLGHLYGQKIQLYGKLTQEIVRKKWFGKYEKA